MGGAGPVEDIGFQRLYATRLDELGVASVEPTTIAFSDGTYYRLSEHMYALGGGVRLHGIGGLGGSPRYSKSRTCLSSRTQGGLQRLIKQGFFVSTG